MTDIYGTVESMSTNRITAKTGKSYTVHIANIKSGGEVIPVEFGFNKPSLDVGRFYKFTCEKKYGKLSCSSFEASSAEAVPAQTAAPAARSYGKVFPVPADHPDRSIIRQNALAHATNLVVSRGPHDAGVSYDELVDLIIQLAYKFEAYSTGDLEARAIEELTKEMN